MDMDSLDSWHSVSPAKEMASTMEETSAPSRQWENDLSVVFDLYTTNPRQLSARDSGGQYWADIHRRRTHDSFLEGMLLRALDWDAKFPFLHYSVYNTQSSDTDDSGSDVSILEPQVKTRGYGGEYEELYAFVDHQTPLLPKRPPTTSKPAYIITLFKACTNCREQLEETWSYWSGADLIVETIPSLLQLKRLTFHKLKPHGGGGPSGESFAYILLCELGAALAHPNRALEFVSTLKDRQCGLSSLYTVQHYF